MVSYDAEMARTERTTMKNQRDREIPNQLMHLQKIADQQRQAIELLRERLAGVMGCERPATPDDAKEPVETKLGGTIATIRYVVEDSDRVLRDILDRLEL